MRNFILIYYPLQTDKDADYNARSSSPADILLPTQDQSIKEEEPKDDKDKSDTEKDSGKGKKKEGKTKKELEEEDREKMQ